MNIYAGKGYEGAYEAALFLVLPLLIPLIQNVGIEMQRALNKHQFRSIIYLIIAISNVAISIPLAAKWGAVGAAMGTAISLLVGNGLIMNIFYHKVLRIDMKYFWSEIAKTWKGFVLPALLAVFIMRYVRIDSLVLFVFSVIVFAAVYCVSVFLLSCNEEEKRMILSMVGRRRS